MAQDGNSGALPIDQATLPQLQQIKQQLDQEIQNLTVTAATLSEAASRFHASGKCVEQLHNAKPGEEILVPLTYSLYIPGKLSDMKSVLVEVGTGYYCEKSVDAAKKYCDGKVSMVNEQLSVLQKQLKQKHENLEGCVTLMQARQQEAAAAAE